MAAGDAPSLRNDDPRRTDRVGFGRSGSGGMESRRSVFEFQVEVIPLVMGFPVSTAKCVRRNRPGAPRWRFP